MVEETPTVRFILTTKSLKEAKRKYCDTKSFYVVDIGKIIRELIISYNYYFFNFL